MMIAKELVILRMESGNMQITGWGILTVMGIAYGIAWCVRYARGGKNSD